MKRSFAKSVEVDMVTGMTVIDGVPLPWRLALPGPTVEYPNEDFPIAVVNLPIQVDGTIIVNLADGRRVYDSELGDVGEFARRMARREFSEAFPWLHIAA